jgi:hypothetical protein
MTRSGWLHAMSPFHTTKVTSASKLEGIPSTLPLKGRTLTDQPSWWLNIACAFRDGIVGGTDEKATKGPYNVTALPLLTGEEVEGPTLNMYEYTKRGTSKEMPFSILGNRGGPIRILRGHALKSKFAPKIGVRYDGL